MLVLNSGGFSKGERGARAHLLMLGAKGPQQGFLFSQDNSKDGRRDGEAAATCMLPPMSTVTHLSTELDLNHKMGKGMSPLVLRSPVLSCRVHLDSTWTEHVRSVS